MFGIRVSYILNQFTDSYKKIVCYNRYMINEIWKPVIEIKRNNRILKFEGYEVSNLGNVRSYKARYGKVPEGGKRPMMKHPYILADRMDQRGYILLCLSDVDLKRYNIRIHTIVAQTFLGFPDDGLSILHHNDIKTDNRLENLRYGTQKENLADYKRNNL